MGVIVIDGDFLCQDGMNGIHRYMHEILKRIDKMLKGDFEIHIVLKDNRSIKGLEFQNITVKNLSTKGADYRGLAIPAYVKSVKGIYCSMSNGLIATKNSIATIMDIIPLLEEAEYSFKSKMHMKLIYNSVVKYAKKVVTISEQSKMDIVEQLGIPEDKIFVTKCGWEHIKDVEIDGGIFKRLDFPYDKTYFYTLGNSYPYKNTKWICEVARRNKDYYFVVAGTVSEEVASTYGQDDNIILLGNITDSEHKALLLGCEAFLYPSKYEGFGLPPIEALALGKRIIISDASCMPEIYGDVAYYIDPDYYEVDLDKLLAAEFKGSKDVLGEYSWQVAASQWYGLFEEMISG